MKGVNFSILCMHKKITELFAFYHNFVERLSLSVRGTENGERDADAIESNHLKSSLMRLSGANQKIRSTRYRLITAVAIVIALLCFGLHVSPPVREKESRLLFSLPEKDENKTTNSVPKKVQKKAPTSNPIGIPKGILL
jgi:hypothetical protein